MQDQVKYFETKQMDISPDPGGSIATILEAASAARTDAFHYASYSITYGFCYTFEKFAREASDPPEARHTAAATLLCRSLLIYDHLLRRCHRLLRRVARHVGFRKDYVCRFRKKRNFLLSSVIALN